MYQFTLEKVKMTGDTGVMLILKFPDNFSNATNDYGDQFLIRF